MITMRGIHKSFDRLEVLRGVDLDVRRGEILSIVGASGAGKTTLLQILGTLDRPDSGTVDYEGTRVSDLTGKALARFRNRNIGFVFQFHHLLPEFTALENICIPAWIKGDSRREATRKATALLELLRLEERASHKPSELSGGEQQRVSVARALINSPRASSRTNPRETSTPKPETNCTAFSSASATSCTRPLSSSPTMPNSPPCPTVKSHSPTGASPERTPLPLFFHRKRRVIGRILLHLAA